MLHLIPGARVVPTLTASKAARAFLYMCLPHGFGYVDRESDAQTKPALIQQGKLHNCQEIRNSEMQERTAFRASYPCILAKVRLTKPFAQNPIKKIEFAMKKIVFCALFALAALPGSVAATAMPSMEMAAPEMRIYDVLERAADELGRCFDQMCNGYDNGSVTVEREGDNYRVTILEDGGGVLVIAIEDLA